MSDQGAAAAQEHERRVSWLELFFDLVVVAAIAQLAHRLVDIHDVWAVAAYAALYYAIWSVWTAFTLYANVSAERTRQRLMLVAMFGIAVMAAAVPSAAGGHGAHHDHTDVFIIAYVLCRVLAAQTWQRTGKIMGDWPAVQLGAGMTPWIASIWVEPPARYYLWAAGIVLDIVSSIVHSHNPDKLVAVVRARMEQGLNRRTRRGGRPIPYSLPSAAELDAGHLQERLGLFVIIVLGEAALQVVSAASKAEWTYELGAAAVAGFALLVGLWWLSVRFDVNGLLLAAPGTPPARVMLPLHFTGTASITAVAAGLGAVASEPDGRLGAGTLWVLCGGLAVHLLSSSAVVMTVKAPPHWLLGWVLPCVAVPVLLGAFGAGLPAWSISVALVAVVGWYVSYPRVKRLRA
ncbi:low temperature requirement protein A [Streptosporangium sp. NPDC000396]|uniref:low temperature requirement protein A n=1 Tax=Streptosporangium sp. NPDC000396 TaxID=3366185 RepID=UPI0036CB7957